MREDAIKEFKKLRARKRLSYLYMVSVIFLIFILIGVFANLGDAKIGIVQVAKIIFGKITMNPDMYNDISRGMISIVWDIRLPRIIVAIFVGAGLAVSGAVFQSLLMNPLADPYTIGISTGAALGASIAIYIGGILGILDIPILPAAFLGAIITLILVTSIASRGNGLNASNLIIAGIIVSSIMSAGISFIKNAAGEEVGAIVFWIMGSFSARSFEHVIIIVPIIIIGVFICSYYAAELNILCTGEDNAYILGVNVKRVRLILIITASLITAACISVSGIIGFVGLVIPHLLRFGLTSDNKILIPLSSVSGGLLLLVADNFGRLCFASEIPVGVLTTLVGGPFFIYLFLRRIKKGAIQL